MNYKHPLLNLITRGHLNVKNRVAMENFINGLDNDSCATILENLLFNVDSRDCARKLDNLLESYQFKHHIRTNLSETTINNARDKVLMKEGEDLDSLTDFRPAQDSVNELIKLAKWGMFTAIAAKLSLMAPARKRILLNSVKQKSSDAYKMIISNPILASILPQDAGFLPRTAESIWTLSKKPLKPQDLQYLNKIGKMAKGVALVAAGITSAIIAVNILYKQLFSAEAKKCNGMFGKKRTICMANAIIAAAEAAQKKAEENLLQCDQAKDPQECRFKMKVEIRSWMKKVEEQKRKLAKLQINSEPYPTSRPDKSKISEIPVGTSSDPFAMNADTSKVKIPVISKNPFE